MDAQRFSFEVDSSVIFKLGEDLITDDYQALVELVKNSYDADADRVAIRISTDRRYVLDDGVVRECVYDELERVDALVGMIEVRDDGTGMTVDDIRRGWLTISASRKLAMKQAGETTDRRHRTPMGDKGLGRLGAQRLGRVIELRTRVTGGDALRVTIDWDRFRGRSDLSRILLDVLPSNVPKKSGTILRIYGLANPHLWHNIEDVQSEFARIVSPYADQSGLSVGIHIDGQAVDLLEKPREILRGATVSYDLTYRDQELSSVGHIRLHYLADLRNRDNRDFWERQVKADGGRQFFDWLAEDRSRREKLVEYRLCIEPEKERFRTSFDITLSGVSGLELDGSGAPYDPGSFVASLDFVLRYTPDGKRMAAGTKRMLDKMGGVRFYRDGFGIRLKDEVFPLAEQWTSGKSYYTLRPQNVLGHLDLSARDNPHLEETTDREEFIDNEYYRNFRRLLKAWVQRTQDVQEFLRRSYLAFRDERARAMADLPERSSRDIQRRTEDRIAAVARALPGQSSLFATKQAAELSADLMRSVGGVRVLADRLAETEDENERLWELAGLGIIAESVSHEMRNVADRLMARSREMVRYNKSHHQDVRVDEFAALVEGRARLLVKQISHLDPALRYVRDKKATFPLFDYLGSWADYMRGRSACEELGLGIEVRKTRDFSVHINEGRLVQVLDNLFYNSEYWLREDVRAHRLDVPRVIVSIEDPLILFEDNGTGVDRSVERTLFDPFVSRKADGRGLGLYIARNLLGFEGVTLSLSPDRNAWGNRFRFVIDLREVEVMG